ncbi:MAG: hypothetical protein IJP95_07125, partial [Bacteroidales bacterium]|nr:hypothetical protein [Bacteroidales bacterium]
MPRAEKGTPRVLKPYKAKILKATKTKFLQKNFPIIKKSCNFANLKTDSYFMKNTDNQYTILDTHSLKMCNSLIISILP